MPQWNNPSEAIMNFLAGPRIGIDDISVEDLRRYELAFTHSSVGGKESSYERLEFLGDRVLNLIVAEYLFNKQDSPSPGYLLVLLRTNPRFVTDRSLSHQEHL